MQLSPQNLPASRAHHQYLPWGPGWSLTEQALLSSAKQVPRAFGNPRVRDQGKKNKKTVENNHCLQQVPSENAHSLACPQGGDPKGPNRNSVPYPEMPEMSVLPHGNNTLLPIFHPPPDRAAHATSGVQCGTWAGRQLDMQSAWLAPSPATSGAPLHRKRLIFLGLWGFFWQINIFPVTFLFLFYFIFF